LPRNTGSITLVREAWQPPASYPFAEAEIVPFRAGVSVGWRLDAPGCA
jgi:dihydroorotase